MDPVAQMLINDYGVDPRTAALMARDASAAGSMQMSGGVSASAMGPALKDSAATGQDLPDQYQTQIPAFAGASQRRVSSIDSHLGQAQSAMAPVYSMLRGNQQQVQGNNAQALSDSIVPRPAPYNPANDPTGQGMAAHQDLDDSVDRGAGFDPQAAGRFSQPAGKPTVSPGSPTLEQTNKFVSSIASYQKTVPPEHFRQQMLLQQQQLQQQLAAVQSALGNSGSSSLEMGDVSVKNAPSLEMGSVSVANAPKYGAR